MDRFLGAQPLDRVVGRAHLVTHAGGTSRAVPLPHPSGASSWVNLPPNAALLDQALALLAREFAELGVARRADRARRSA